MSHEQLIARVRAFEGARIWVVGDLMLDEYLAGGVGRISPEAPVPVVSVEERFTRPGGAANVARSVVAAGGQAVLCGAVGSDPAATELEQLLVDGGIEPLTVRDPSRPTTRKLRVLGQGQQLLRLDWEDGTPVADAVVDELIDRLLSGPKPDAIAISDYAKGFVTPTLVARLVEAGDALGVPILVDPKRKDPTVYRGATLIKPNRLELEAMAGRKLPDVDAVTDAARDVLERSEAKAMVVTLGAQGLLGVPRVGEVEHIAAAARQVFDVTGAGDTVLALLALGMGTGADLGQAAALANAAAGIVVGEVGTATVDPDQLIAAMHPEVANKRVSREAIGAQVRAWQRAGKTVVFTNGCYDLLHAGHLHMLQQCSLLGDVLVVGVNTDSSVRRLKGPQRPLVPEHERAGLVGALDCVDAVVLFGEDTPLDLLEVVRPDILAKGDDYRIDQVVGRELVESLGGRVHLVPLLPERSTTALVQRILDQRREDAD